MSCCNWRICISTHNVVKIMVFLRLGLSNNTRMRFWDYDIKPKYWVRFVALTQRV